MKERRSQFAHSMYSSSGALGGFMFSAFVTGITVEAATSNSSCLLAVCPVSWPAPAALTKLFCLSGVTDSSYLMANFVQCRLKTTSSLTGRSGLSLPQKEHIVNQWYENNVKRAFIYSHTIFNSCNVYCCCVLECVHTTGKCTDEIFMGWRKKRNQRINTF